MRCLISSSEAEKEGGGGGGKFLFPLPFFLFRSSTGYMMPTHAGEGDLLTESNANLIQKHPQRHTQV